MRIVKLSILGLFASSAWSMLVPLQGQECGEITIYDCPPQNRPGPSPTTETVLTDAYSIEFSSASGAVGDVVAVPVILNSQIENPGFISLDLAICHDPTISEVVGAPLYTDEFLSLLDSSGASLYPVDEANDSPQIRQCGHGFLLNIGLDRNAYNARFPSNVPLNMMTLFYRLKGTPGASGQVEACDASLIRGLSRCNYNHFHTDSLDNPQGWDIVSTVHSPGILTVLAGPATHPNRPPEPPKAKVYPGSPNEAQVNFRVRIDGAVGWPGAKDIAVDVFVASDFEFTAVVIPVDFDERYLRISKAENHFLTGVTLLDNRDDAPGSSAEEGNVVIYSGSGINSYRLAAEGEEVLAARLYFDVLDAAREAQETALQVLPVTDHRGVVFAPWIGVLHTNGTNTTDPAVRSEISPIQIANGIFKVQTSGTIPGDANLDYHLEISDPISILSSLFLGSEKIPCPEAADFNGDGRLDVSDPIAILDYLFLGGKAPLPREILCNRA